MFAKWERIEKWQTLIFVYLATDNMGQLNPNYGHGFHNCSVLLYSPKENLSLFSPLNKEFMLWLGTAEPQLVL